MPVCAKQLIAVLLMFCLLLGMFPARACAEVSAPDSGPLTHSLTWTDSWFKHDNTLSFVFDPALFADKASVYDHELAILSLGMVLAVQSRGSLDEATLTSLYSDFGFHTNGSSVYSEYRGDGINDVACTMSLRKITVGADEYTLLAINTRGGRYRTEWISSLDVGSDAHHRGFVNAAVALLGTVESFCLENGIPLDDPEALGTCDLKIWVTGFSRSAAVSNYLGKLLNDRFRAAGRSIDDIYVYTFATPNNVKPAEGESLVEGYENIFNIVSPDDLVPKVPFDEWGFGKYGVTKSLPSYGGPQAEKMIEILASISESIPYYKNTTFQNWAAQTQAVASAEKWISNAIPHDENFDTNTQPVIDDIASYFWSTDITEGEVELDDSVLMYLVCLKTCIHLISSTADIAIDIYIRLFYPEYVVFLNKIDSMISDLGQELKDLDSSERDLILKLISGADFDTLTAHISDLLSPLNDVPESGTKSDDPFEFGGHIIATHRMETYLAWLLSDSPESLFGTE